MKPHVLIGFAEAVPAPEVFFDLRAAGHRVSCFTRAGTKLPILKHLPFEQVFEIPSPESDTPGAVAGLSAILDGFDGIVFPLDDTGLWMVNAASKACKTPPVSAGAEGAPAEVALDKLRQIEAAERAGISVPPTLIFRDLSAPPDMDMFPAIAKPAGAISLVEGQITKGDVHYLMSQADVAPFLAGLTSLPEPMLIQPLIHGRGEGVFGYCQDGEVVNWSGHFRVRMMNPHGSGSSACQTLMPDAETQSKVTAFLRDIGWQGPFMMEFLRGEDDTLWFMELNGRMWGSLALALRAGFSYPAWAVARALDPAFAPPLINPPAKPLLLRHLARDLLHLAFVLRGPKSEFHAQGWPKFWTSLKGVFAPTKLSNFYNYQSDFKRFIVSDTLSEVWRKLRS